ncbi:MAG: YqaA family protein, partial [Chloroflexota bacterium]
MTGGALLAFSWAVAEATVWPIMPDALTVPMALHRPRSWWQLVAGAMLGTALGGAVSYLLGRLHSDPSPVERLWLVRPAMVTATSGWLREDGARGAWRQPATGVPFKVFARLAGHHGLPPLPFLGWAVLSRTVRFLVLTRTAALI